MFCILTSATTTSTSTTHEISHEGNVFAAPSLRCSVPPVVHFAAASHYPLVCCAGYSGGGVAATAGAGAVAGASAAAGAAALSTSHEWTGI